MASWPFAPPDREAGHARDHLIVRFRPDIFRVSAVGEEWDAVLAGLGLPAGAELLNGSFQVLAGPPRPVGATRRQVADTDLSRRFFLRLPPGVEAAECATRLARHPRLAYVELDGIGRAALTIPSDPNFPDQWHHHNTAHSNGAVRADIHTPAAWDITRGSSNVVVALLDSGINASLAEFAGRILPGYDFVRGDNNPNDETGHGTAIAAILAANANNAAAVAGVDWNCRLMPLKVVDANDLFFDSWVADALDWATTNGCKVINLSVGKYESSQSITEAITNAIARGLIVISLTSNDGTNQISFPGSLPEVITVGATDQSDRRAEFSNYGTQIDLVAPGTGICTLNREGGLWFPDGTSASAPMVAGVAALLAAVRPDIDNEMAHTFLCAGADDQVGVALEDTPGFDIHHGWGRLNAYNSLILAQTRLQHVQVTPNRQLIFSWNCPANAEARQPYRIEFSNALSGPWQTLPAHPEINYSGTIASWIDDLSLTGGPAGALKDKFFRIRIVLP